MRRSALWPRRRRDRWEPKPERLLWPRTTAIPPERPFAVARKGIFSATPPPKSCVTSPATSNDSILPLQPDLSLLVESRPSNFVCVEDFSQTMRGNESKSSPSPSLWFLSALRTKNQEL